MILLNRRSLKEEQIKIRLNLVVAIAIAQITFLAGIDASETKVSLIQTPIYVAKVNFFFFMFDLNFVLNFPRDFAFLSPA